MLCLYLFNFCKEVSQLTNGQTYKKFRMKLYKHLRMIKFRRIYDP